MTEPSLRSFAAHHSSTTAATSDGTSESTVTACARSACVAVRSASVADSSCWRAVTSFSRSWYSSDSVASSAHAPATRVSAATTVIIVFRMMTSFRFQRPSSNSRKSKSSTREGARDGLLRLDAMGPIPVGYSVVSPVDGVGVPLPNTASQT